MLESVAEGQATRVALRRDQNAAILGGSSHRGRFPFEKLQAGESLGLPHSRPMPSIGKRCHELRIHDRQESWRVIYRIDRDAIVIAEVFKKKTQATPKQVIEECRARFRRYDEAVQED